jgi:predicted membrane-bound spermidine synthase
VFLISFCVLALEIALSRLFSVVLRYHFVFLIISVAICGLGFGGLALHVWTALTPRGRVPLLPASALGFTLSTLLALILLVRVLFPYHLFSYWTMALVLLVPFFFAGVFLADVFRQFSAHSGKIYGADLIGAAVASVAVIGMLQWWGAINACLWIAAFALPCLPILHVRSRLWVAPPALAVFLALLFFARGNKPHPFLDIQPVQVRDVVLAAEMAKPLFTELTKPPELRPKIIATEWTAFARTDVVEDPEVGEDMRLVYTNGHVPTNMIRFRGNPKDLEHLRNELGYFPFGFSRPKQVLCIGPGAGMDVWFGILSGARQIDGVEINPSIVPLMRRYRDYNGGLYERPNVRVVTGEGRSFVQRARKKYDLIFLALTQTSTSGHSGMTLMESYIHTLDAFRDYWDKLTPNGQLALITQDASVAARFFATGVALLKEKGKSDPAACEHIALIRLPDERLFYGPYRYLFLLKKTPWTKRETQAMSHIARAPFLHAMFIPRQRMEEPFVSVFNGRWTLRDFIDSQRREHKVSLNIAPCTDDAPFFLDLSFGVPPLFYGLCAGAFGLVVVFGAAAFAWKRFAEKTSPLPVLPFIAYFSSLGVGFMLIEIPLMQKLILVLGYPTLALAVILFALLMGGGLGSFASQRWQRGQLIRSLLVAILIVVLVSASYAVFLSAPHPTLLRFGIIWRCLCVTALLLPLGFCLGIPFPSGVRLLSNVNPQDVPWMWGVNGVMSVVGSLLAAIGAKLVGFKLVMLAGAGVYALTLAMVLWLRYRMRNEG